MFNSSSLLLHQRKNPRNLALNLSFYFGRATLAACYTAHMRRINTQLLSNAPVKPSHYRCKPGAVFIGTVSRCFYPDKAKVACTMTSVGFRDGNCVHGSGLHFRRYFANNWASIHRPHHFVYFSTIIRTGYALRNFLAVPRSPTSSNALLHFLHRIRFSILPIQPKWVGSVIARIGVQIPISRYIQPSTFNTNGTVRHSYRRMIESARNRG